MREEAVEPRPVSDTDLTGGEDALGDEAVAAGQSPAGENQDKESESRGGEDGAKVG
jgi:hypothetical protein